MLPDGALLLSFHQQKILGASPDQYRLMDLHWSSLLIAGGAVLVVGSVGGAVAVTDTGYVHTLEEDGTALSSPPGRGTSGTRTSPPAARRLSTGR